jgi:hypothetical protein
MGLVAHARRLLRIATWNLRRTRDRIYFLSFLWGKFNGNSKKWFEGISLVSWISAFHCSKAIVRPDCWQLSPNATRDLGQLRKHLYCSSFQWWKTNMSSKTNRIEAPQEHFLWAHTIFDQHHRKNSAKRPFLAGDGHFLCFSNLF